MLKINQTETIFYEKYRPQTIDDLIIPESLKIKIKNDINSNTIPHMAFFSNSPGTGKSSTAKSILADLGGEAIFINSSLEKGIDVLRGRISDFITSGNSFDGKTKIIVLDECLEENEEVRIGTVDNWHPVKLNQLEKNMIYRCPSINLENGSLENDTCEVISDKIDEIFEVELEDGRVVKVTANHPFIVELDSDELIEKSINDGLCPEDNIKCIDVSQKIKSITPVGRARVINLTVHKNHTFITKSGIVTHNCDALPEENQKALRGLIEAFAKHCRFIITGNYKEKLIPAFLDRFEVYDFNTFPKEELVKPIFERLEFILKNENIEYQKTDLVTLINTFYPSIRSMIKSLQKYSNNNKLVINLSEIDQIGACDRLIELIKKKDFNNAVLEANKLNSPSSFYKESYKKIDNIPMSARAQFVVIIAKYQHMDLSVRDKNLNLAACCAELMNLKLN